MDRLETFLPYLLNQAGERASQDFQALYKARYGMLRTEWRVLFHLGLYGALSAKEICSRAGLHKTKVSRAVAALEAKRFLKRAVSEEDRRVERLALTAQGQAGFEDLREQAAQFEDRLLEGWPPEAVDTLKANLIQLSQLPRDNRSHA